MSKQKVPKEIDKAIQGFINRLVDFLLYIGNKDLNIFRIPKNHPKFLIRDSIVHRLGCIRFHLDLLLRHQEETLKHLTSNFPHSVKDENFWFYRGIEQFYLFDDIIFHICSLFDYMGNLIGLLYCGKGKKWNSILRSLKDKNNKLNNYGIAVTMKKQHSDWLKDIMEYRGELFHSKLDFSGYGTSIDLGKKETTIGFCVDAPKKFLKHFEFLINSIGSDKITLIDSILWIVTKTMQSLNKLLNCCKEEIETDGSIRE